MEEWSTSMASNLFNRIPPLFSDLAKILAGEIDCSIETLTRYSRDASSYHIPPQAVIYPKNSTDIKHVLGLAREYGIPVTTRGSGRSTSGGSIGEGIILDMSRYFTYIRGINFIENTISVDAGVPVGELLDRLNDMQVDIPYLHGLNRASSIGSVVATRPVSASSFLYGSIREWVEGMTVVVDNGEEHHIQDGITPSGRLLGIYQSVFPFITKESALIRAGKPKVHDDPTGYTLWSSSIGPRQLLDELVGSEGTLAIITQITLRLTPYKEHSAITCIPIAHEKEIPAYVAIAKHHTCEQVFLFDETTLTLARRELPHLVPTYKNAPYTLLVTHKAKDSKTLHKLISSFKKACSFPYDLYTIEQREYVDKFTSETYLDHLYHNYSNGALRASTLTRGIIVPLHLVPLFIEEATNYLNRTGYMYSCTGYIGSGNVMITILFDPLSKKYDTDSYILAKELFLIAKKYHGGISAVSGEGIEKTPFLPCIYTKDTLALFRSIKAMWDPLHILNPGKKTGTQVDYLQKHLQY